MAAQEDLLGLGDAPEPPVEPAGGGGAAEEEGDEGGEPAPNFDWMPEVRLSRSRTSNPRTSQTAPRFRLPPPPPPVRLTTQPPSTSPPLPPSTHDPRPTPHHPTSPPLPSLPAPPRLPAQGCVPMADGEYEVIVMGTGFTECLLSGLLCVMGMKVPLHQPAIIRPPYRPTHRSTVPTSHRPTALPTPHHSTVPSASWG